MSFRGHAIIITVDTYASPAVGDLGPRVAADGDAVADLLADEDLCGYSQDRITRLSGNAATGSTILGAISGLKTAVSADDPVLLYFSGHGDPPPPGSSGASLLLPHDFEPSTLANALSGDELGVAWQSVPSKRKLAIIDACYSGGVPFAKSSLITKAALGPNVLDRLASGRGSVALASSRDTETSLIFDRDPLSLFTKHLVGGLRGSAGHDSEGYIRVFDLFTYVSQAVRKECPRQHPIYSASHQEDNFPISHCGTPARRKQRAPIVDTALGIEVRQLTELFAALYPLGPMDQAIWERAGGDTSRLVISQQGRTDWFRALQTLSRGGGGVSITTPTLVREALGDYPHHPDLKKINDR